MTTALLNEHQAIWKEKPALRAIYQDYYQRVLNHSNPGQTLEVGGGTGNLKEYLPNVISTDILTVPWLDASCDAQRLPFANNCFDNIVAIDVLHHIENPRYFFREAERVLKKGGKIILIDPAITAVSWGFYHFLHPEPVIFNIDPLAEAPINQQKQAFDANQAIPELLFGTFYQHFIKSFPRLQLIEKHYLSLFAYPLSGGFRKWSLIPKQVTPTLLRFEKSLEKRLGKYMGFRLFIVIEKKANV